jgi:hypothetical protein
MKRLKLIAVAAGSVLTFALPLAAQQIIPCFQTGGPGIWAYCSVAPEPQIIQKTSQVSSGSVASINKAFTSNTKAGNSIIVVFSNGNNNNPTAPITDTQGNTFYKATQVANSTTFESSIWYTSNIVGGADTVTVTPGGSNASIAMEIYEVAGLVTPALQGPQAIDQTTTNTGTATASPAVSITPIVPNEYVFVAYGLGTAAQTITVTPNYVNDSGQQNPTTPAGLYSFVSASLWKSETATTSPAATAASSEPWAVAVASFKSLTMPVQAVAQGMGAAGTPSGGVLSVQGVSGGTSLPTNQVPTSSSTYALAAPYEVDALTTTATVKSSTGNVYGFTATNTNSSICYLQVFNTTAPTLGTTEPIISIGVPGTSSSSGGWSVTLPVPVNFTTAIAVAATTASKGGTTCATGMTVNVYFQ